MFMYKGEWIFIIKKGTDPDDARRELILMQKGN